MPNGSCPTLGYTFSKPDLVDMFDRMEIRLDIAQEALEIRHKLKLTTSKLWLANIKYKWSRMETYKSHIRGNSIMHRMKTPASNCYKT
ncbi:UNVERIFIED_CONTAM: hypothetical protein K2H54_051791 [Gekko kuhli]